MSGDGIPTHKHVGAHRHEAKGAAHSHDEADIEPAPIVPAVMRSLLNDANLVASIQKGEKVSPTARQARGANTYVGEWMLWLSRRWNREDAPKSVTWVSETIDKLIAEIHDPSNRKFKAELIGILRNARDGVEHLKATYDSENNRDASARLETSLMFIRQQLDPYEKRKEVLAAAAFAKQQQQCAREHDERKDSEARDRGAVETEEAKRESPAAAAASSGPKRH